MALQGDLDSFALPEVLRLLAGTDKTGRLAIIASPGSGEVWLADGELVGGSVTTSPHATGAGDLIFELLRLDGGSFIFEDGDQLVDGSERSSVADAIEAAEHLMAQWAEVEAVVPSVHASVAWAPEITGDEVTISSIQWNMLAALGAGTTVRGLGDRFEITDLEASTRVMDLVESGLVELGEASAEDLALDGADPVGQQAATNPANPSLAADLALLSAEAGPVVLESRHDALLPEPLPGEGTSFDGNLATVGAVDSRTFEAAPAPEHMGWATDSVDAEATDEAPPEWAPATAVAAAPETDEVAAAPPDDAFATAWQQEDSAEDADRAGAADPAEDDAARDDRGSLMKFLSTVRP